MSGDPRLSQAASRGPQAKVAGSLVWAESAGPEAGGAAGPSGPHPTHRQRRAWLWTWGRPAAAPQGSRDPATELRAAPQLGRPPHGPEAHGARVSVSLTLRLGQSAAARRRSFPRPDSASQNSVSRKIPRDFHRRHFCKCLQKTFTRIKASGCPSTGLHAPPPSVIPPSSLFFLKQIRGVRPVNTSVCLSKGRGPACTFSGCTSGLKQSAMLREPRTLT